MIQYHRDLVVEAERMIEERLDELAPDEGE